MMLRQIVALTGLLCLLLPTASRAADDAMKKLDLGKYL